MEPLGPARRAARLATAPRALEAEPPAGAGRRRLGAALDAAVGRLDPEAATIYGLLSVFPAGFDASSTAAVADCGEATARAVLGRLADASLVVFEAPERRRARLLQPVRAHAAARLTPPNARRPSAAWRPGA